MEWKIFNWNRAAAVGLALKYMEQEGNRYRLIRSVFQLDRVESIMINAAPIGGARQAAFCRQEATAGRLQAHCTGCWVAGYSCDPNLSLETIDRIIRRSKALEPQMYLYTGGEPMVRKAALIRLCAVHPYGERLAFTTTAR